MTIEKLPDGAQPLQGVEQPIPWEELVHVLPHSGMHGLALSLSRTNSLGVDSRDEETSPLVEISSGGSVFFCVLSLNKVVVLKFVSDRLLCQSEVFASEIAQHLGVNGPQCRIMLPETEEWASLKAACYGLYGKEEGRGQDRLQRESILHCLEKQHSLLVIEYIPGTPLLTSEEAIEDVESIAYALGQVLALDMILGNPDRLCVKRLGWPGNPHNILFGRGGRFDRRVVCIDAVVQRKPPQILTSLEDASCEALAELAFNDVGFVKAVLEDALFDNSQLASTRGVTAVSAALMQRGMIATWRKAGDLRGIFEMLLRNIDEWIEEFVDDMDNEGVHGLPAGSSALSPRTRRTLSRTSLLTNKIRLIQKEAGRDELMTIKLEMWNQVFKSRMEELLVALESWVMKQASDDRHARPRNDSDNHVVSRRAQSLTTAFLNPQTARPFVDLYELGLRLRHVLRRLAILASALSSSTPSRLAIPAAMASSSSSSSTIGLSNVFIGCAVAANSFHVLRSLNITHFLNATEDLFLSGDSARFIEQEFEVLRVPLRDEEDEDIEPYFFAAAAFIEEAVQDGGRCLVHCHAGQSRSCALVIAWLLLYRSLNLRDAIGLVQQARPSAAPNAGYMQALGRLEEQTCGSKSRVEKLKKPKPEALECPECGEVVGISQKTLAFHLARKHNQTSSRAKK